MTTRLRPLGLTPTLADYVNESCSAQLDASGKRPASIEKEKGYLRAWVKQIGGVRLNKTRPHHVQKFLTKLSGKGYAARSVNLYLLAIRGAIKAARRDGHIKPPLPYECIDWKKFDQKARSLYTPEELDLLCEVSLEATKNGRQFVDYLRFLQFSGARRTEALRVRWDDVNFERGQVTIGAEGDSKNREPRVVDFNPRLADHLRDMHSRRQPDSQWLFPSPQRGKASHTYMESLRLARAAVSCVCQDCRRVTVGAETPKCGHCGSERIQRREPLLPPKLQRFGFHDARHHFVSLGVMSGIDYMTLARWVGHKNGGVLIGKVYGHLADEHRKAQAARLNFGPAILPLPKTAAPGAIASVPETAGQNAGCGATPRSVA